MHVSGNDVITPMTAIGRRNQKKTNVEKFKKVNDKHLQKKLHCFF